MDRSMSGTEMVEKKFDLEKIVNYPTWREMLMDIMLKENIDPWDIDISHVTTKYLEKIKEMKTLELHIPANIILAAAILLRIKSNTLIFEEVVQEVVEETYVDDGPVEIPVLELRTRIPPKRRITWGELLSALEDVFRDEKRRAARHARKNSLIPEKLHIELPELTLDEQIEEVKKRIMETIDSEGLTMFSSLLKENSREEKIRIFLPLLFMFQKGEVSLIQEQMFGEILIHTNNSINQEIASTRTDTGQD